MYERILCRLCSQGGEVEQKLRGRLLLWVAMAFQPVTIAVMQYACVTVDGHKAFDPEEVVLPTPELMLETCGSLLEVFDGDKLRFSHHTVKDFLLQPLENLSEDARGDERVMSCMVNEGNAHACMAMTCGAPAQYSVIHIDVLKKR